MAAVVVEPISVGLQFGFLAVLYLFLLWVVAQRAARPAQPAGGGRRDRGGRRRDRRHRAARRVAGRRGPRRGVRSRA